MCRAPCSVGGPLPPGSSPPLGLTLPTPNKEVKSGKEMEGLWQSQKSPCRRGDELGSSAAPVSPLGLLRPCLRGAVWQKRPAVCPPSVPAAHRSHVRSGAASAFQPRPSRPWESRASLAPG